MSAHPEAVDGLVCITVVYHPDPSVLRRQLLALPRSSAKLLVDNGTPDDEWQATLVAVDAIDGVHVLRLGHNAGLAAAVNAGVELAGSLGDWTRILLLDQDSEPRAGSVERLCDAHAELTRRHSTPVAVGPTLWDPATGMRHSFHRIDGWRYRKIAPIGVDPIVCHGLNGSGTLAGFKAFAASGGLEAGMFIDHLDTEWSFRVGAAGWRFFGIPDAEFLHRMGDASRRVWLGRWQIWPLRSPWRHRMLFRNAVWLMGRDYVPFVWKAWAIPKLLLTAILFGVTGPDRKEQIRAMAAGCIEGWRGRPSRKAAHRLGGHGNR